MSIIIEKIDNKLNNNKCKMFWCIPVPSDNGYEWEVESFNSDSDDLSNWGIIIHKLKHLWKKDFESCNDKMASLPRGVIYDGVMFHGNNTPIEISDIAKEMGVDLGYEVVPKYDKKYGIKDEDVSVLEGILGCELHLKTTE